MRCFKLFCDYSERHTDLKDVVAQISIMNESLPSVKQLITLSLKCSTCVAASLLCSVFFLVVNELLGLLR